jgi:SAM-dependent methyltransferase
MICVMKPMDPSDVATSYDLLAHRWASPEFNGANGIAQHRRALQFLQKRDLAIDIGCGCNGRLIDLLIGEGFEVEGLDISAEMIRRAQIRHPHITFHHTDICRWSPDKHYDFITAWDSIWHVPLASQPLVLTRLCQALAPNGVLIFTAGGLDEAGETHDSHMGVPMYHASMGIPETLRILHDTGCVCRHLEYDQHPELHVYFIAQKRTH